MQICWILLAESGDFSLQYPLNLIRVRDPKFGKPANIPVKLNSTLPKIIRLTEEVKELKQRFLPVLEMDVDKGIISIGSTPILLSPIEFCYYRYFLQRLKDNEPQLRFSGIFAPSGFLESIYEYHEETFPDLDVNREPLRQMIKKGEQLTMSTVRGNISKLNKKLRTSLANSDLAPYYEIHVEGIRGAKYYNITLPVEKIFFI